MKLQLLFGAICFVMVSVSGYWDIGTTTTGFVRTDTLARQSFFRWQTTQSNLMQSFWIYWDWVEIKMRRRLNVVAGISIDFTCLGTASILNRRTLITSANYLDPYFDRQRDIRIWALGRAGYENTPYRYRVWRLTRLIPKSLNPEHWHGPRGIHSPRHDVCIIHTMDQMYIAASSPGRWHYAYRTFLTPKRRILREDIWFSGSGFEYLEHIKENYKIFYARTPKQYIVDCSKYLPKWWGKFICIINYQNLAGVPNGGGLYDFDIITGLGAFEIRYNEDRIMVFTDLRYYHDLIHLQAYIKFGEYYEYAYPEWSIRLGFIWDSMSNDPYIPTWMISRDLYPLGKRK